MALSHNVIGMINFIATLLSIPIIGAGIWLTTLPDNSCVKILQWPVVIIGILILVVGIAGFVGGFWRIPWLLLFYLVVMLVLIILLGCMVVFIYMVTLKGAGHLAPSRSYLEYRLDDYSGWLRRRVQVSYKWDQIRACLSTTSMCPELNQSYRFAQDFFNARITPLQSGCCKPPTQCGFTFVNPTYWISPINTAADMDCLLWNNEQTQLCYGCDSCKAGLLANIRSEWRRVDIILLITLIALICVYLVGCCAFRNAKTEDLFRKYKQGYT
ncbi:hypothetical protein C5167_049590 [Papaver somniferum]|uniref:Uncharacterized protein n=1 Tax=Papaver somniferum TaxID=3469 RepID=A0A4Y7KPM1_PAPSO|nr:protein TORNADO 2-like [Papaver somniferum]RZC74111.1 hypothetical protein C5167_049590 [Papaver somniferum]